MTYNVVNGTSYDARTPQEVIKVLERAREYNLRIHISYGETEGQNIGKDWLEEHDVCGYVNRSNGSDKIPLIIFSSTTRGGPSILDNRIVRIRLTSGSKEVLYQHPNYHHGKMELKRLKEPIFSYKRTLTVELTVDGKTHAAFENMTEARRFINKIGVVASIAN